MSTPYAELTESQQKQVIQYDSLARQFYMLLMEAHLVALKLSAVQEQNSSLFNSIMNMAEELPIPVSSSVCAQANTTNSLYNAKIAADDFITANVTAKTIFRVMIGADYCEVLG
jgi:hypothetical protein